MKVLAEGAVQGTVLKRPVALLYLFAVLRAKLGE